MLTVRKNSWHHRLYEYWQRKGGNNRPGYKENLCHYCRVVALWAPKRWLIYARFWGVLSPWMIAGMALVTASLILWPPYTLLVISYIAAVMVIRLGPKILKKKLSPIWLSRLNKGVTVVTATIGVAGFLALLALLGFLVYKYPIPSLLFFVAALACGIGSAEVVRLVRYWKKRESHSTLRPVKEVVIRPVSEVARNVGEVVILAAHYAIARKRRICPFIELPE